jgi:hypothetical protein
MPLQLSQIDFTQFRAQDDTSTKRIRYGMYTGPVSYSNFFTSGGTGDPAVPGDFGLGAIHNLDFNPALNASGTLYLAVWVTANQVPTLVNGGILWYVGTTQVEVANGVNLSGYTCYFQAVGY